MYNLMTGISPSYIITENKMLSKNCYVLLYHNNYFDKIVTVIKYLKKKEPDYYEFESYNSSSLVLTLKI